MPWKGKTKCTTKLIIPQTSLIQSLHHVVRGKGFRKLIHDSHSVDGQCNEDPNFVMEYMHDAPLWYNLRTGIKREVGNLGTVRDVPVSTCSEQRLTDHRFGLRLTINTDWCVSQCLLYAVHLTSLYLGLEASIAALIRRVQYTSRSSISSAKRTHPGHFARSCRTNGRADGESYGAHHL